MGKGTHYNTMIKLFGRMYSSAYEAVPKARRAKVADYLPVYYYKWLSSCLIADTLLTPYNLLYAQMKSDNEPTDFFPQILADKNDISFKLVKAQIDGHPLIDDLKLFMQLCSNGGDIDKLRKNSRRAFLNKFSVPCTEYIKYLADLSVRLKLNIKIPSINSSNYKVREDYPLFFSGGSANILQAVVKATIDECADRINEILPLPKSFKHKLYEALRNPVPVGEIFQDILGSMEIDYERFIDLMGDGTSELEGVFSQILDLTKITLGIGVCLDQYFIMPFGCYLKIIQPIYFLPVDFDEEFQALIQYARDDADAEAEVYSPCSAYCLTDLGREFFGTDDGDILRLPKDVSPKRIFNALERNPSVKEITSRLLTEISKNSDEEMFTFLLKTDNAPVYSAKIEIGERSALAELYDCICGCLGLNPYEEYSFYLDDSKSPFTTVSSPSHPAKGRKADKTTISSLHFSKGRQFELEIKDSAPLLPSSADSENVRITIEVVKVAKGKYGYLYPRVFGEKTQ